MLYGYYYFHLWQRLTLLLIRRDKPQSAHARYDNGGLVDLRAAVELVCHRLRQLLLCVTEICQPQRPDPLPGSHSDGDASASVIDVGVSDSGTSTGTTTMSVTVVLTALVACSSCCLLTTAAALVSDLASSDYQPLASDDLQPQHISVQLQQTDSDRVSVSGAIDDTLLLMVARLYLIIYCLRRC